MKHLFYIILIPLFCFNITAFAQNPEWINYTDKSLINVIEIEDNFLWIGTTGGVVKYDTKTENRTFFTKSNSGLPGNYISSIAVDSSGNKWIGTGEKWRNNGFGLAKFDGTEWTVYNTANSDLPSNDVYCITVDKAGVIWIGTERGLAKFDGENWDIFIPDYCKKIYCIVIDEFDNKWMGTDPLYGNSWELIGGGLAKFDGENWIQYDTVGITMQYGVSSIAIDIDGSIWVGNQNGGLAKFDGVSCTIYWTPGQPWNGVVSLAIDNEGNKWIGTDYSGLGKFDNVNMDWYEPFNSPAHSRGVLSIKIDDSGNKWIGCRYVQGWSGDYVGAGLVKYNDTEFTSIDNIGEELLSNDVRCITIDGENNKWIGTFGGLSKFDGSEWSMYNSENSDLPGNFIKCLATNSNGDLWIGSEYSRGLTKFDGTDWIVYDETNSGLPSNIVSCIAIDEFDSKWVGTRNGLVLFDYPYCSLYNPSYMLPDNDVLSIAIEEFDTLWVGTANGLEELELGNIYNTSNSGLPDNRITCIAIDDSGSKWIGTREGLAKFDGSDWQVYNTSNSDIPSNTMKCITIDESDNKWIGTREGLAKFDGTNWQVYNTSNSGLPNNSVTCVATDIYGNTWIGTGADGGGGYGGGLAVFNEGGIVTVEEDNAIQKTIPNEYALSQNYPNPFNPSTTIKYAIPSNVKGETSNVKLIIYDVLGREVATLVNEQQKAGYYEVNFNASSLTSGIYFYHIAIHSDKLNAGSFIETKKMLLLR